jgi:hypothetical protein
MVIRVIPCAAIAGTMHAFSVEHEDHGMLAGSERIEERSGRVVFAGDELEGPIGDQRPGSGSCAMDSTFPLAVLGMVIGVVLSEIVCGGAEIGRSETRGASDLREFGGSDQGSVTKEACDAERTEKC